MLVVGALLRLVDDGKDGEHSGICSVVKCTICTTPHYYFFETISFD